MVEHIEKLFPRLRGKSYRVTSPQDETYNCVAWAAGDTTDWWWPAGPNVSRWPDGVPRVETLEAFREAFASLGFVECASETAEPGFEKIALFTDQSGLPKHAARQLPGGQWTSKIGKLEDLEHELRDLEGPEYGSVVLLMKRPLPAAASEAAGTQNG